MNELEQFFRMCDCPEVQEHSPGIPLIPSKRQIWCDNCNYYSQTDEGTTNWRDIWLPRQGQIQELMGVGSLQQMEYILMDFAEAIGRLVKKGKLTEGYIYSFDSLEKTWLTIYMLLEHQKIWNGKKWIRT